MNSEDKLRELEAENRRLLMQTEKLQHRLGRLEIEIVTENLGRWAYVVLACLLAAGILLSMYPLALSYAQSVYNPTKIPAQYQEVISWLEKKGENTRVMWLPLFGAGHQYDWVGSKRIGPFEVWSSNPSLNDYLVVPISYGYWLERDLYQNTFVQVSLMNRQDLLNEGNLASRLFTPFNARYMVLDQSIPGYDFGDRFDRDSSLQFVHQAGKLKVYKIKDTHDLIWPASQTVKAQSYFDDLCLYQKLSPEDMGRIAILNGAADIKGPNRPLVIDKYEQGLVYNGDFEEPLVQGWIPGWLPAELEGKYTVTLDTRATGSGKKSLKVVNRSADTWGLGWVAGTEIPARPGTMYTFDTRLKYRNTTWAHAAVAGYEEASQKWVQLMQCPSIVSGDSGWQKWSSSFVLPEGYSKIRPMLAAGWVADPVRGPSTTWFDSISLSQVDNAMFEKLDGTPEPPQVTFKEINAEKYVVHVKNAERPFVLVFGEFYDTLWVAKTDDGKTMDPVKLYDYVNGFPVNRKGTFDITIEYLPEGWYHSGLLVSIVAVAFFLLVLVFWSPLRKAFAAIEGWPDGLVSASGAAIRSYIEEPPGPPRRVHPTQWLRRVSTGKRSKTRMQRFISKMRYAIFEEVPEKDRRPKGD